MILGKGTEVKSKMDLFFPRESLLKFIFVLEKTFFLSFLEEGLWHPPPPIINGRPLSFFSLQKEKHQIELDLHESVQAVSNCFLFKTHLRCGLFWCRGGGGAKHI